jgi:hypothetical protein
MFPAYLPIWDHRFMVIITCNACAREIIYLSTLYRLEIWRDDGEISGVIRYLMENLGEEGRK